MKYKSVIVRFIPIILIDSFYILTVGSGSFGLILATRSNARLLDFAVNVKMDTSYVTDKSKD